jgi:N-acetylmuramoyl-L-alanine amidase
MKSTRANMHDVLRPPYLIIIIILLIGVGPGCAPRRGEYEELYAELREEPAAFDQSVLAGRRIVIDPGHGGAFDGAVGTDSLTEADVNLGVALYLWGLLKEAGAAVSLTRSTDRDFLPEGSSGLRDDLAARTRAANALRPEVFISIHHNANLPVNRDVNKIEVYYRGGDTGASLDLAGDVRLHLARNLGIERAEIKPGNYHVLRNSAAAAAVLGEASYLSHPVVEQRLKISNKQRIEAESYFLGLVSYFSRGVPSIERTVPTRDTLATPADIAFRIERGAGVPLDGSSARLVINDETVTPLFEPETETMRWAMDAGSPNGTYIVRASIRSVRGGSAESPPCTLLISRPARHVLPLPPARTRGDRITCRLKVLDELGRPVADGSMVNVTSIGGETAVRGGCSDGVLSFAAPAEEVDGRFLFEAGGLSDTIKFDATIPDGDYLVVVDEESGEAVPFPQAISGDRHTIRGDERGAMMLPPAASDRPLLVGAKGYRPARLERPGPGDTDHLIRLAPIHGGLLRGKRIALNPAGGGIDDDGIGPRKLRGATINLAVANRLRDMLAAAGADAYLSRTGEESLGAEERIHRINRGGAELAIGIHHGAEAEHAACRILHYPGSEKGAAIAASIRDLLAGLPPCAEYAIGESAATFLQQTSCPACEIHAGAIHDRSTEQILAHPRYAQIAAERLFSAIIRYFGGADDRWRARTLAVTSGGRPVADATICIDQAVSMTTDPRGYARFSSIDAGRHVVVVTAPGEPAREPYAIDFLADGPDTLSIELKP